MTTLDVQQNKQIKNNKNTADEKSFLARNWQKIIGATLWLSLIGFYIWYQQSNNLTVEEMALQLAELLTSRWGIAIFILAYLIRPLFFLSATNHFSGGDFWPRVGRSAHDSVSQRRCDDRLYDRPLLWR